MRKFLILGAALLAAGPAQAQPAADDGAYEPEPAEVAIDPRALQAAAGSLDALVGAVMDLQIGGIVAAVDPLGRSGYGRGDTVRDMAARDDPYAEARLRAQIRGTGRTIGAMSQAIARIIPVLQDSLREFEVSLEGAIEEAQDNRP